MGFVFNDHWRYKDQHAFLSASKPHWLNYTDEKLLEVLDKSMDAALGTRLHALAKEHIELGIPMVNNSQTLNLYVNDCIGYRMKPEVMLFYSPDCFGTADAIKFDDNILRIFDLKNGITPAKPPQLEIYAGIFCLEYKIKPSQIELDLRIYQNDDIQMLDTDPEDIAYVMDRIREADALVRTGREAMQ